MDQKIKDKIIANGVKGLKDYGYPDVNKDNCDRGLDGIQSASGEGSKFIFAK